MNDAKEITSANIEMNDVVGAFKRVSPDGKRGFYESYKEYPTTSVGLIKSHFKGIASFNDKLIFTHTNLVPLSHPPGKIMIADKQTSDDQTSISAIYDTTSYHAGWSHPCSAQACGSFMAMGIQETDDISCYAEIHILDLTPLNNGSQPVGIGTIACVNVSGGQPTPSAVNGVAMTKEHGDNGKYIIAGLQGNALTIYKSVNSVLDPTKTDNQFYVAGETIQDFPRSGAGLALITQTDGAIYVIALDTDDDAGTNNRIYLYQLQISDTNVTCSAEIASMPMPVPGLSEAVRYATGPALAAIMLQDPICGAFLTAFATGIQDINLLNTSFRWGKGLAITSPDDIAVYATDRDDLTTSQFSWPVDTQKDFSLVTWTTKPLGPGQGVYVFHQGYGNNRQLWNSVLGKKTWYPDTQLSNVGITDGPSAVVFKSKLYVVHQGNADLWYSAFDGETWLPDTHVPNVGVKGSPSAVVFNTNLYVFHQGNGDLWYSVFDGNTWQADAYVPNVGVTDGPSAVEFNGMLYVFHQGNGDLWYSVFDGNTWYADTQVPNVGVQGSPSAVVFNGKLYVFHQGNGALWYSVFDGTTWDVDTLVPNVGIVAGPSAVVLNNNLYVFHQGNGDLWYSIFDGNTWQADTIVPNVGVSAGPSAVYWNGK